MKFSLQRPDTLQFSQVASSVLQSPIYIGKQVLDSINSIWRLFTQYIIEGINDLPYTCKNPKQTAETMILLLNIWLSPLIFLIPKKIIWKNMNI